MEPSKGKGLIKEDKLVKATSSIQPFPLKRNDTEHTSAQWQEIAIHHVGEQGFGSVALSMANEKRPEIPTSPPVKPLDPKDDKVYKLLADEITSLGETPPSQLEMIRSYMEDLAIYDQKLHIHNQAIDSAAKFNAKNVEAYPALREVISDVSYQHITGAAEGLAALQERDTLGLYLAACKVHTVTGKATLPAAITAARAAVESCVQGTSEQVIDFITELDRRFAALSAVDSDSNALYNNQAKVFKLVSSLNTSWGPWVETRERNANMPEDYAGLCGEVINYETSVLLRAAASKSRASVADVTTSAAHSTGGSSDDVPQCKFCLLSQPKVAGGHSTAACRSRPLFTEWQNSKRNDKKGKGKDKTSGNSNSNKPPKKKSSKPSKKLSASATGADDGSVSSLSGDDMVSVFGTSCTGVVVTERYSWLEWIISILCWGVHQAFSALTPTVYASANDFGGPGKPPQLYH